MGCCTQDTHLPLPTQCELISYYYLWKKTNVGLSSRTTRRQRKQTHIRLGRANQKTVLESPPKREFSKCKIIATIRGHYVLVFHTPPLLTSSLLSSPPPSPHLFPLLTSSLSSPPPSPLLTTSPPSPHLLPLLTTSPPSPHLLPLLTSSLSSPPPSPHLLPLLTSSLSSPHLPLLSSPSGLGI